MKNIAIIVCLFLFITSASGNSVRRIKAMDFGIIPGVSDCTPALVKCLAACNQNENTIILFDKGTYHFYPDYGKDEYCFVSNNDEGLKRIIFLLKNINSLTIDGQGASFIFHGFVNPFVLTECRNITFRNFSVDCARPFHSEATILASMPDALELEIPEQFPYRIQNNILLFTGGDKPEEKQTTVSRETVYPYGHLLEFDTRKRETAYMARDYYLGNVPLAAQSLDGRKVRIFLKGLEGTPGNTLVFGSANRNYSGFTVTDCENIRFENITVYHAGGMGIVAQRTRNVTVESCKVTPSEGRILSTTADATHFVNCTGKIELSHCLFENQMDDATNIHGIYVQIARQLSPDEVIVQLKHPQQLGFDFLKPGTRIEFVQGNSLITEGEGLVTETERLNKEYTRIKLDRPLPAGIRESDALCELRDFPEIHIHHNYIGKNRARGMLLNCRGKTVVENNIFHSPGAAILFEGDAGFWFEQGGVSDCTIRNNIFDNCLFGVWGQAVIDVQAGIREHREISRYNKNIKIYDNTFRMFDRALLLHAYGVDGLHWKNNKIEITDDYPAQRNNPSWFKTEYCDRIRIKQ